MSTVLKSPPKPRREISYENILASHIQGQQGINSMETNTEVVQFNNVQYYGGAGDMSSFESCLVDKAVKDLPSLATQVFTLCEGQTSELNQLQRKLDELQRKTKERENYLSELNGDMKCLTNKIYGIDETINDINKTIRCLDSEIQRLVTVKIEKEILLDHKKEESEIEKRDLQCYIEKMYKQCDVIDEYIKSRSVTYPVLQDLKQQVEKICEDKKAILESVCVDKDDLLTGNLEGKLNSEINEIESDLLKCENEAAVYESKIHEQKSKNNEVRQNIQVAHKRNAAQMTRLKKQLADLRERNNRREKQLIKLKNDLIDGEKRLTEH
ncbi:hypothetical protein ACF0H5_012988 [Mactra antiquata]